ncbi:MAG: alpha/beta fold hydrolase, partial [Deltaproteobacteria bacterium]|nr:alpha/beta fold hydrolase [Deltaproteobacteria bacterium]
MLLRSDGTEIHIVENDAVGTEKDPALLFIHGAGGDASIWDFQAAYFRGIHLVFRLDLPGHGGSGPEGEEEIGAYAHRVRSVIQRRLSSVPLVLVGHSMGGAIVQELALDPPGNIEGLVLVGTGAKLGVMPAVFDMLREDPEGFFRTIDAAAFHPDTPREIRDPIIDGIRRCPPPVIFKDFAACNRFDIRDRLSGVRLPTF